MNSRLQSKLLRAVPPAPKVERIPRQPVVLTRIPWGKRDAALGRALCQHVVDATPPLRDLPAMCACYALVALLAVMVLWPDLVLRAALAVLP